MAIVQSVIVVSSIYYINKLYMYIKIIHVQIHIYAYMYTYIRAYTYTNTLVTFSAEAVIFGKCIWWFPEFHKVTLFAAISLFRDNCETIYSPKIHLKLFQKQYNNLIENFFLILPIYKKSKTLKGRVSPTRRPCTVTLIVSLSAEQYYVCLLFCDTNLYNSLACIPKNVSYHFKFSLKPVKSL